MKKFLLGLFIMFVSITSVYASSGDSYIPIEGIELKNYEVASYNGVLEVEYKLVPIDADNKKVKWSISNLKSGVTAAFTNGSETNSGSGKISIKFKNENDDPVTVKLTAKIGSITKIVDIKVEDEDTTNEREINETVYNIEKLINNLPKEVNSDNHDSVSDSLDKISDLIDSKEEIEELVDSDLMDKYNNVIEQFESYKEDSNVGTIIIIVILGLSFLLGLFMIFKKED